MATISFQLNHEQNKKGERIIRISYSHQGKRRYRSTKLKTLPKHWDNEAERVTTEHPNHKIINAALNALELRHEKTIAGCEVNEQAVDLNALVGENIQKHRFKHYGLGLLGEWEQVNKASTMKGMRSKFKLVNDYAPTLFIEDISPEWLQGYDKHCRLTCTSSGVNKRMKIISKVINEALVRGIITKNPFKVYKMPMENKVKKTWLDFDELNKIEKHLAKCKVAGMRNAGYWFLFACYTGLRWSDVNGFNPRTLLRNGAIQLYAKKNNEPVYLPVNEPIERIMPIAEACGNVMSNQKCNQYLKLLAEQLGLQKYLTFHVARHSFAVNCASLGMSIEVAGKMLGHSNLRTTSVYYKLTNPRIAAEMQLFNNPKKVMANLAKVVEFTTPAAGKRKRVS